VVARYDGVAEWYDREFAATDLGARARQILARLLGSGPGRLLDIGCGGGLDMVACAEAGWAPVGVDISEDQLRLARTRGCEVVRADASRLPFRDGSFDAVISAFTHTDVDDFPALLREAARVLRPDGTLVYLGVHPCFVGPHAFVHDRTVPDLHPGYRDTERRTSAPGIWSEGLRSKVGARHLPLGLFVQAFLDAGFRLERFEEPHGREYPHLVALRARR
jgi:ubiquinone/menaquinone biosynthesis C-methylase UbiE